MGVNGWNGRDRRCGVVGADCCERDLVVQPRLSEHLRKEWAKLFSGPANRWEETRRDAYLCDQIDIPS